MWWWVIVLVALWWLWQQGIIGAVGGEEGFAISDDPHEFLPLVPLKKIVPESDWPGDVPYEQYNMKIGHPPKQCLTGYGYPQAGLIGTSSVYDDLDGMMRVGSPE